MTKLSLFCSIKTDYIEHIARCDIVVMLLACLVIFSSSFPIYASDSSHKNEPEYIIVPFDPSREFGDKSVISTGSARLYQGIDGKPTVCVNAGHGTEGGSGVKTMAHPDGTPKVTGGSSQKGAVEVYAVTKGMTFADGTPEAAETLRLAIAVRDALLEDGFSVLMPRYDADARLDNVARAVIANASADCHVSLHYDATSSNKGVFYIGVPNVASYRGKYPVRDMWRRHEALGQSVISAVRRAGIELFQRGRIESDLTQTSYSTVPSIVLECGDRITVRSDEFVQKIARAVANGIEDFLSADRLKSH